MDVTQPASVIEAQDRILAVSEDLQSLSKLITTDNLKYLTRSERELLFKRMLDNVGALEDTIRALIKSSRDVRRVRLRDDEQLSRMVIALASLDLRVGDFESPADEPKPEIVAEYSDSVHKD